MTRRDYCALCRETVADDDPMCYICFQSWCEDCGDFAPQMNVVREFVESEESAEESSMSSTSTSGPAESILLEIVQHPAIIGLLEHDLDKLQIYLNWRATPSADTLTELLGKIFDEYVPTCCVRCWRTAHVFADKIVEKCVNR